MASGGTTDAGNKNQTADASKTVNESGDSEFRMYEQVKSELEFRMALAIGIRPHQRFFAIVGPGSDHSSGQGFFSDIELQVGTII